MLVYKYPVGALDGTIDVPRGARLLSADLDPDGQLCVWAQFDPLEAGAEMEPRSVLVVATGRGFEPGRLTFLDTVRDGAYMWHVYAEGGPR
jgi:hypothetical protein